MISISFDFSIRMATSRFWYWLRSTWQETTMPVGICVSRTAEEVLLTFWPPAPLERKTSILMSSGLMSTCMVSSISGMTSRETKEVCRRPEASNGEMRTKRCTPVSLFMKP